MTSRDPIRHETGMGQAMTVFNQAESLTHADYLPLSWSPLAEPQDAVSLERLAESNVSLMARVQSLEERHRATGEEGELEQEISRLHGKIDLLIALVSELARERLQLPPPIRVLLSAATLHWSETSVPPVAGTRVMISLYLNPCISEPLRLPALIERSENGEVQARFAHPSESCKSALEQHVFLHHRRAVAETRNLNNVVR